MKLNYIIHNEEEMHAFASKLAQHIEQGCIIYLHGFLGAGKTTFVRGFLRALGYQGKVKSPTYTLVEPYEVNGRDVYHFDLYRLNDSEELVQIGIREYFTPGAICLIEWPEKGQPLLPKADINCHIEFVSEGRKIMVEAGTERGEIVLAKKI